MKIAILGASGKLGKAIVEACLAEGHRLQVLVREPSRAVFDHRSRIAVTVGDALDEAAVAKTIHGADAVISALGPDKNSPADFCSRSMAILIAAMKQEEVERLAVVTGAMVGPSAQLGWAYRTIVKYKPLAEVLADRRASERLLQKSGLRWTIVRPPRLASGKATRQPEVSQGFTVSIFSAARRADVARLLLQSVEGGHEDSVVYIRTRSDAAFVRSWILRCGFAELAAMGLAATAAVGGATLYAGPNAQLASYLGFLVVGAVEGILIGFAQGSLLKRVFPRLDVVRFAGLTALVAAMFWAIGMAPSTFFAPAQEVGGGAGFAEPALWVMLATSVVGGGIAGLAIAFAQSVELRHHTADVRLWTVATAIGWALALPLDMLGASLPSEATPAAQVFVVGAGFGLLAGIVFAIPTAIVALRWKRAARPPRLPGGTPAEHGRETSRAYG